MKQHVDIPDLLDRYWAGETTLEEERRLKAFFASENIPEQYRQVAPFFQAIRAEQAVRPEGQLQPHLSIRPVAWYRLAAAAAVLLLLSAGIFWWASQPEPPLAQVQQPLTPTEQPKAEVAQPELSHTVAPSEVPASIVMATVKRKTRPAKPQLKPATLPEETAPEDSFDDPEQALAEIKAALALVSSKINRSKQTLEKGLQEVDQIDILVKKKKENHG